MLMAMRMIMLMPVFVVMFMRQVNIEFYPGDGRFLLARNVEMIAVELEFFQLAFEPARVHAQVQQRGDEHVAGNAADEIEIEDIHFYAKALIWLAA